MKYLSRGQKKIPPPKPGMELNCFSITIPVKIILHAQRLQSQHPLPEDCTEHGCLAQKQR